MSRRKRVALIIETSNEYARGLLHGIRDYMREHGPWQVYLGEHSRGQAAPEWLRRWEGDGVIARIENPEIAALIKELGKPAVDLSAARLLPRLPMVETDDQAIAQLAFDHLTERGMRHLAYVGDDRYAWSRGRQQHFVDLVARAELPPVAIYPWPQPRQWEEELEALGAWLAQLPRPTGVMACYDNRGLQVLEACRHQGLAVPQDVAVVGVDNDELLCELADPPLTSVAPDADRTGYIAAELLDRMMQGKRVRGVATRIKPIGVVRRRSTDLLATADVALAKAVEFMRAHACEDVGVGDVVAASGIGRRALEIRFKALVGRSPHQELIRLRLEAVKELLRETDLPLTSIAERCGFNHVEYLCAAFKHHAGVTPGAYRKPQGRT